MSQQGTKALTSKAGQKECNVLDQVMEELDKHLSTSPPQTHKDNYVLRQPWLLQIHQSMEDKCCCMKQ